MLSAISLFTGVGGLDYGFEAAGFQTAVAVEFDHVCCGTLRANRRWNVLEGDIHEIRSRSILRAAGVRAGEADVLIGGPPCQPFSKSGYWARGDALRLDDPRADTLSAFLRVLRDARPRAFLLENVGGLAFRGKDEGLRHILDGVELVNRAARTRYRVHVAKLNAADYGVPQVRERVFLIAARDGTPFRFPDATHADAASTDPLGSTREAHRTAWDAIGDLPADVDDPALRVAGEWGDLLPSIPEGANYLWHTTRGGGAPIFGWRRRYWNFLLKLSKGRPGWTVQAQPGTATGPFHWRNRRLTTHELARIQTFPEGLSILGSRLDVQRMLGNAVPSLLAEVLAREVAAQLLGRRRKGGAPRLLQQRRGTPPPPEPLAPVPARYLANVGSERDHPGEGLGPGAARRAAATRRDRRVRRDDAASSLELALE